LNTFHQRLKALATYLGSKMAGYTVKKQKTLLVLFCLVLISISVLTVTRSLLKKNQLPLMITPISTIPPVKEPEHSHIPVPTKELTRIHLFHQYLDSLKGTSEGKRIRDSLLKGRPHLLDTLIYLENLYVEQVKQQPYGAEQNHK
jgi:hypothetical protein